MVGRVQGQAPDIDAQVYFDRGDPERLVPGALVSGVVSGTRGYDLIVTPD